MADLTTPISHARPRPVALSREALLTYGGLTLIVLLNVWGNLYWILRNVSPYGRDAGGHLTRALQYAEVLETLSWQSLFEAVTFHGFRPPALYLAAQVPYRLFGHSMDAAQTTNVFFLVVILLLTFSFARHLAGERVALLATAITGLFPMMAAMSRMFYLDLFVTAMVMLILFALLRSENFARRRWAVVWGLAVGLGMLVKWSLPAHILLPILFMMVRADLVRAQLAALRRPSVDVRALGLALVGAVALAGVWYLPNRAHALTLPLGDALFGVWVALLLPALYALARPSRPLTNFWAGVFLGAALASLWYVARIDFLDQLVNTAIGDYDGRYEGSFNPWQLNNYVRYPRYLVTHHLGILGALVLLPVGLWPWLRRWRGWRSARLGALLLWMSVLSTYLFLAFTWEDGKRNLVPLLPMLAIFLADSLVRFPRRVAWGVGAAWLLALALHWSVFTFDALDGFYHRTEALWADAEFLQRPASGATDPGFWLAPDVLTTMRASHDPQHGEQTIFGMLINAPEIHRGPYHYLIRTEYPELDLRALTERAPEMWIQTVQSEWVLSKTGDNHELDPAGLRALSEVYDKPEGLFPFLFDPVRVYPLPNGESATLWRREIGPRYLPQPKPTLQPLADTLTVWLTDQPLLLDEPEQALDLGLLDLTPTHVQPLAGARPTAPTLFVLLRGEAGDPETLAWLAEEHYPAYDQWFDTEQLSIWGKASSPLRPVATPSRFEGISLTSLATVSDVPTGHVIPLEMKWEVDPARPLKASVRLLDGAGQPVAQLDRDLTPTMRLGLFVPPSTAPGSYTLALSLYDPTTLEPLSDATGVTLVTLGEVTVSNVLGE